MKPWVKAAVSISLLALILWLLPWGQVVGAFRDISLWVWLGVLAGYLAGHAIAILKWRLFINVMRAGLSRVDATLCYSAGLFANLFLPTIVGGDLVRIGLVTKITKRPIAALWGGVMDRLTDMVALAILMVAGGVITGQESTGWIGQALLVSMAVGLVGLGVSLPLLMRKRLDTWPRPLRRPVGRGLAGIRQLQRRPTTAAAGLLLSLLIQGGFVLLNAWLGRAIGIDIGLGAWLLAWPLAKLAGLIPISLGGLAVREASLAAFLLPFAVPAALSVVCSLLWQSVLIAGGLLAGAVWLLLHGSRQVSFRAVAGRVVVFQPESK